ncbi:dephospho-CoA kinase [Aliisedimentitalea scapharcae]|uniref:Dephospho-CoA kinase n=1 Tax=Aliisedimentitalea scapharcae TaxID=1524259 RepID=A0ABZ2XV43_9RHOB
MSFALGLTGSIGMGKSTTAGLFSDAGCDVWDADAAVHRLYEQGGAAVSPIRDLFPEAVIDGRVSRDALKRIIGQNPDALKQIESVVHPLVALDRTQFRALATSDILVFDIPLLFETGGNVAMDAVACVSIPDELQKNRVMDRGTMTVEQFEHIRKKQLPNDEKVARSDYVIITDTLDHARQQVEQIVASIREGMANA